MYNVLFPLEPKYRQPSTQRLQDFSRLIERIAMLLLQGVTVFIICTPTKTTLVKRSTINHFHYCFAGPVWVAFRSSSVPAGSVRRLGNVSHGLERSNFLNSCANSTGSTTTRLTSSS